MNGERNIKKRRRTWKSKDLASPCSVRVIFLIGVRRTYVLGSKSFRTDIQKPCQMEKAVRDI